jgi:hypothetical protein
LTDAADAGCTQAASVLAEHLCSQDDLDDIVQRIERGDKYAVTAGRLLYARDPQRFDELIDAGEDWFIRPDHGRVRIDVSDARYKNIARSQYSSYGETQLHQMAVTGDRAAADHLVSRFLEQYDDASLAELEDAGVHIATHP